MIIVVNTTTDEEMGRNKCKKFSKKHYLDDEEDSELFSATYFKKKAS